MTAVKYLTKNRELMISLMSYFDNWPYREISGKLYLEPPSSVITARDFEAVRQTGILFASVEMRTSPRLGVYLVFIIDDAWRKYLDKRQHSGPRFINHTGDTDVVDMDWWDGDEMDRTPTPRMI